MSRLSEVWKVAAGDLGIRVLAPYRVNLDGVVVEFDAHICDFGGPDGIAVVEMDQADPRAKVAADRLGLFYSELSGSVYSQYVREEFIDTLDDWGWFGSDQPPSWFTANRPWTD